MATDNLPPSLEQARIPHLPSTAYYIPDFISEDEERFILGKIASAPKPRWKQLTHRRLQTWPSDLVRDTLIDAPLPPWLQEPVTTRLRSLPLSEGSPGHVFERSPHGSPNHVLINEYPPGDGSAYWPVVCTVSLGASLCLNLYRSKDDGALDPNPAWRILQEPRSLLITTDSLYTDYLHGIDDIEEDADLSPEGGVVNWPLLRDPEAFASGRNSRETRTSLTYRDVLKVSKVGNRLAALCRR
ncbi:hypothetical protein JDV02_000804 [Purpureocillium takamizusanense]|uniref:Uncharacterized protein n=1 Tax=Purpureocillium takamizusanense TaxID=2060973 RepID=A0A9Q8Q5J7_9HYPO|nr:uncharacterized protein JDV02_000804 [Purpureocillium takamizusanense]UNI14139.1 hypothetical protein JDV02_000804 [Purpureocillium takamizusanense]